MVFCQLHSQGCFSNRPGHPIASAGFASSGVRGGLAIPPHYPASPPSRPSPYRAAFAKLSVQGGMVLLSRHLGPHRLRLFCQPCPPAPHLIARYYQIGAQGLWKFSPPWHVGKLGAKTDQVGSSGGSGNNRLDARYDTV